MIAIQLTTEITLPITTPDDVFVARESLTGLQLRHRDTLARTFSLLFHTIRFRLVFVSSVFSFVVLTMSGILVHFLAPTECRCTY